MAELRTDQFERGQVVEVRRLFFDAGGQPRFERERPAGTVVEARAATPEEAAALQDEEETEALVTDWAALKAGLPTATTPQQLGVFMADLVELLERMPAVRGRLRITS